MSSQNLITRNPDIDRKNKLGFTLFFICFAIMWLSMAAYWGEGVEKIIPLIVGIICLAIAGVAYYKW